MHGRFFINDHDSITANHRQPPTCMLQVPFVSQTMAPTPEAYHFSPTPHVPNSILPVLIYRNMLPANPPAASTRDALEKNSWLQGGVFKTYRAHHFHSVTHECYAIFKGSSRLLLGRGPLDDPNDGGIEVDVSVGDIIVLPVREHITLIVPSPVSRARG